MIKSPNCLAKVREMNTHRSCPNFMYVGITFKQNIYGQMTVIIIQVKGRGFIVMALQNNLSVCLMLDKQYQGTSRVPLGFRVRRVPQYLMLVIEVELRESGGHNM